MTPTDSVRAECDLVRSEDFGHGVIDGGVREVVVGGGAHRAVHGSQVVPGHEEVEAELGGQ
jgi:hypothetical protein